jgi:cell division protein FtsB
MTKNPYIIRRRSPAPTIIALVCLVSGALSSHPGFAQSESQVRHQAARQSQQIEDLEAEVKALQARITTLETVVRDLRDLMAALESSGEDLKQTSEPLVVPAEPLPLVGNVDRPKDIFESPASILAGLKWDFRDDLTKDPSFALGVDSSNERARLEATNILNSWLQRMNRIYRKSVTWPVRVLDEGTYDKDSKLFLMQALAPDGTQAGDPFSLITTNRIARRIEGWKSQPKLDRLLMTGTCEPNLMASDTIETSTDPAQENPPPIVQVSPYVSFKYSIRLSTIMPVFAESEEEESPSGP